MRPAPLVFQIVAALLATASLWIGGTALLEDERSPARRTVRAYARWVEHRLRPLFLRLSARQYALRHAGGSLAAGVVAHLLAGPALGVLAFCSGVGTGFYWPTYALLKRRARLETQLDPALRNVAQTLKATANLVDAFETVARQMEPPMAEEIELVVRQHRLGVTVEDALREMSARCGSRNLDAAVTAIVIGRMTGGNLPEILEEIAAVLRERMRLEAFIDAKTAEGKAQAWVMGSMPLGFAGMVYWVDPTFIRPLFGDPIGWAILGAVFLLIVLGVYWVRKISTVDV